MLRSNVRPTLIAVVLCTGLGLVAACSSSTSGGTAAPPASTASSVAGGGGAGTTAVTARPVAAKSAGCSAPPSAGPPSSAVDETGGLKVTVPTASGDRWWYQHVPPGYDGTTPLPVVIDFHGFAEGAAIQRAVSRFEALGDQEHFITISPQGQGTPVHWDTRLDSNDLQFVGQVLDSVEQNLCVDPHRVFVAGYSNGAFLSSTIACQYADRVAAIAPVAGLRDVPDCQPARPVPIIGFHGSDDEYVVYQGGMGPRAAKMPAPDGSGKTLGENPGANGAIAPGSMDQAVPDILTAWAGREGCTTTPKEEAASSDTTRISFSCPAGTEVQLYRTDGAGHDWPGSAGSVAIESAVGKTTMTIDATKLAWAFFQRHPLP